MKDRDHNEVMAEMFQADPQFAADYLRRVFVDGMASDVRLALRQMAGVLSVRPVAGSRDVAPAVGLFDRVGLRYEVACDVIGALIAHYAEIIGHEREQAQPDEAVLRVALAMKAALAAARDDLDPSDATAIETAISRYAPVARRVYGNDDIDQVHQVQGQTVVSPGTASPTIEQLALCADDVTVQTWLLRGDISHDEAVQCTRILHRYPQSNEPGRKRRPAY